MIQPGKPQVTDLRGVSRNLTTRVTTITKTPVVTIDAEATTARGAANSIRRLRLDHHVPVLHGDGYLGEPNSAPYDRIIVTCGVAGLSPHWLDQLAPSGLILAPIAHGGVHPILAATNHDDTVSAKTALWADFMPAAGPLRPAELVGHDPADYVPPAPVTRIPDASPARTTTAYHNLWFFLATRDSRITRAYMDDDTVDTTKGACALHTPQRGTAWVHTDGSIAAAGEPTVTDELRSLIHQWTASGHATLTQFATMFTPPTPRNRCGHQDGGRWPPGTPLLMPSSSCWIVILDWEGWGLTPSNYDAAVLHS